MALRAPNADDLRRLAAANHFELSDEEVAAYRTLLPDMFIALESLIQAPSNLPPIKYRDRDPGVRPTREHDPFNAIVRRCSVKGAKSGKLAGKRLGIKDSVCIAGIPMTCGSHVFASYVPDIDATIITRILDAGGEITAILNMDNCAFSGGGDTSAYGATLNPHDTKYLAGGSSGGSGAALYYDDIDMTIGCDQGGSVRIPAAWCGVAGLKPTHSLVPYTGIVGIDHTFDHAGPMAKSVADVALLLEVIAGRDPMDPRQYEVPVQPYTQTLNESIRNLKVGVLTEGFGTLVTEADVDAKVKAGIESLRDLGAQVEEVSVPEHLRAGGIIWALLAEGMTALVHGNGQGYHWQGLYNESLAAFLGKSVRAQAHDLPAQVKFTVMIGTYLNRIYHGQLYAKAQNQRRALRQAYDTVLEKVDVIVMPTTPMKAHRYTPGLGLSEIINHGWNMLANTAPFDMTGHPSLSVPCGKSGGLPIGMMITGRHFEDGTLLRVGNAFEQQTPWEKR
ncbi:MAG TPA: amidase [Bradyrhizobium sp.]|nr:amidase [Candidatus Binataceae bacterium]HUN98746.1 amidase [Bradyrhizobium sp.]